MFVFINQIFIGLLTGLFNSSNHAKCAPLTNPKYKIQPTFINLHSLNRLAIDLTSKIRMVSSSRFHRF